MFAVNLGGAASLLTFKRMVVESSKGVRDVQAMMVGVKVTVEKTTLVECAMKGILPRIHQEAGVESRGEIGKHQRAEEYLQVALLYTHNASQN